MKKTLKNQKRMKRKPKPIWYQYDVSLNNDHPEHGMWDGGLVNIIVFSTSDRDGKEKCGRLIAKEHMQIKELKRAMAIKDHHYDNTGPIFKDLLKKAELQGIAMRYDGWKS
ncbi:MAG: hypothetical protein OCC45_13460 [Desulfotalea sp.]